MVLFRMIQENIALARKILYKYYTIYIFHRITSNIMPLFGEHVNDPSNVFLPKYDILASRVGMATHGIISPLKERDMIIVIVAFRKLSTAMNNNRIDLHVVKDQIKRVCLKASE